MTKVATQECHDYPTAAAALGDKASISLMGSSNTRLVRTGSDQIQVQYNSRVLVSYNDGGPVFVYPVPSSAALDERLNLYGTGPVSEPWGRFSHKSKDARIEKKITTLPGLHGPVPIYVPLAQLDRTDTTLTWSLGSTGEFVATVPNYFEASAWTDFKSINARTLRQWMWLRVGDWTKEAMVRYRAGTLDSGCADCEDGVASVIGDTNHMIAHLLEPSYPKEMLVRNGGSGVYVDPTTGVVGGPDRRDQYDSSIKRNLVYHMRNHVA